MPDLNPNFAGTNARTNGSYGSGPNGTTTCNLGIGSGCLPIQYLNTNAFKTPTNVSTVSAQQYLIGNAPRTRPFNLNNPGTQDFDAGVHRSIALPKEMSLVLEADCLNTWNKVTFSSPSASWSNGSATFGEITGISTTYLPRDWQFAGHINF